MITFLESKVTFKPHSKTVHEGLMNHKCYVCDKILQSKGCLSTHNKPQHKNVTAYTCETCEKSFQGHEDLSMHVELLPWRHNWCPQCQSSKH